MRKYLFEDSLEGKSTTSIEGDLFKHIFKVCRVSEGDKFELLSDHKAYLVEAVEVGKKLAEVRVLDQRELPKLKPPYIHLVLANPRPAVFEAVVEKSVELGVKSIYPIVTKKSFFKSTDKLKLKEARLQKIINQAMQQSGRFEPLTVEPPTELSAFLTTFLEASGTGFVLYEKSQEESLVFDGFEFSDVPENVFLLVGGEGGFSLEEVQEACAKGFKELSLGDQILRVETACVAGISILKSKLNSW